MGYLLCKECGGFYELGEGESADDFESCSCGGKLEYQLFTHGLKKYPTTQENEWEEEEKSKSINKIIIGILLFLVASLTVMFIAALVVYNAYTSSAGLNAGSDLNNQVRQMGMLLPLFD